jgi:hypothetical protein
VTDAAARCAKCGEVGGGAYCSHCGAPLRATRDLSVKHFLKEGMSAVTEVDSSLVASFRSLFTKPGELTKEYLQGNRHRFLPPFRIFLFCNVIYFLAAAQFGFTVLTIPLSMQTTGPGYKHVARRILDQRLGQTSLARNAREGASRDSARSAFAIKYDGATETVGKTILAALIPLFAVVLFVLYVGSRRYFAEHLIFATHFTAFMVIVIPTIAGVVTGYAGIAYATLGVQWSKLDPVTIWGIMGVLAVYAYRAQRVVYETGRMSAIARTAAVMFAVPLILLAFKFMLFLATLYWIG